MSSSIHLTPDLPGRYVFVQCRAFTPGAHPEIVRTDANGYRRPVRVPRTGTFGADGQVGFRDYEAALAGPVEYRHQGTRTNEITNPGFASSTTGWGGGTSATIARDTSQFRSDTASLRLDSTIAGGYAQYTTKVAIPTDLRRPETTVHLGVWAKGAGSLQVELRGQDAADVTTVTASSVATALGAAWTKHYVNLPITSTTTKVWPLFFQRTGGALSLWLDDVVCEINSPFGNPSYFVGTQTNQGIFSTAELTDPARAPGAYVHAASVPATGPQLTFTGPGALESYRASRDLGAQLHWPKGRQDAIDTGGTPRARALTLDFRLPDLAAARQLEDLAMLDRTLVVRHQGAAQLDDVVTVTDLDGPYPDAQDLDTWHVIARGYATSTGPYRASWTS